ncbi:hypothetical protein IQ238_03860 [Pleurocapsales cyanobacterium LEGE 06147]|nr:hypothetical protein [Pleurocapsales cyanobacterium LEGE 06147]
MQTFQQQHHNEKLEQLPPQDHDLASSKLWWLWQTFLDFWCSPSGEPRIWQRTDRFGNPYWRVYDPVSDRTIRFNDKQEVMIWLDERHYHRAHSNLWVFGTSVN